MQFVYVRFHVVTYKSSVYSWKASTDYEHRDWTTGQLVVTKPSPPKVVAVAIAYKRCSFSVTGLFLGKVLMFLDRGSLMEGDRL